MFGRSLQGKGESGILSFDSHFYLQITAGNSLSFSIFKKQYLLLSSTEMG